MAKRKAGSQIDNLTLDHKKSGIDLMSLRSGGMQHAVGKPLTRATTSSQSEVCTKSYSPAKLWEFQPWRFRDSQMGVSGQKAIWMRVPWKGVEYTIWGRWWLPPIPGCGESYKSKVTRGSSNTVLTNLLVGFVQVLMNE
jgi:hypothetical protein